MKIKIKYKVLIINRRREGEAFMDPCKGFEDWLECLKCPHLCTKACPIEGENVMEEMKRQIRTLAASGTS